MSKNDIKFLYPIPLVLLLLSFALIVSLIASSKNNQKEEVIGDNKIGDMEEKNDSSSPIKDLLISKKWRIIEYSSVDGLTNVLSEQISNSAIVEFTDTGENLEFAGQVCNSMGGYFKYPEDNFIESDGMFSATMMACLDEEISQLETAFFGSVNNGFKVIDNNDGTVTLSSKNNFNFRLQPEE